MGWTWDGTKNRYRNSETGKVVTERRMRGIRNQIIERYSPFVDDICRNLADGLPFPTWVTQMRAEVKDAFVSQYILGKGGRELMTQSDWGKLGHMLRNQYSYLDGFAEDIRQGNLSMAQIQARARMYIASSTQAYERAHIEGRRGLPGLSRYPGDGGSPCRANCKCYLDVEEKEREWHIYWRRTASESCSDCVSLSNEWAPLVIPK